MICLICRQAETVNGFTSVAFERGEMRLTVNNVPARVCPVCREAYVGEDVAVRLLQEAETMSTAGTLDGVLDFGTVQPDDTIHS
jgi:YgiT-type zinc finger domain-containing protein